MTFEQESQLLEQFVEKSKKGQIVKQVKLKRLMKSK